MCPQPLLHATGRSLPAAGRYRAISATASSACVAHTASNAIDGHQQGVPQCPVLGLFPQLAQHLHLHPCRARDPASARCAKQMTPTLSHCCTQRHNALIDNNCHAVTSKLSKRGWYIMKLSLVPGMYCLPCLLTCLQPSQCPTLLSVKIKAPGRC